MFFCVVYLSVCCKFGAAVFIIVFDVYMIIGCLVWVMMLMYLLFVIFYCISVGLLFMCVEFVMKISVFLVGGIIGNCVLLEIEMILDFSLILVYLLFCVVGVKV